MTLISCPMLSSDVCGGEPPSAAAHESSACSSSTDGMIASPKQTDNAANSRRKQTKPQRLGADEAATAGSTQQQQQTSESSSSVTVDSHVCGRCAAQFYSLDQFIAHKRSCTVAWPFPAAAANRTDAQSSEREAPEIQPTVSESDNGRALQASLAVLMSARLHSQQGFAGIGGQLMKSAPDDKSMPFAMLLSPPDSNETQTGQQTLGGKAHQCRHCSLCLDSQAQLWCHLADKHVHKYPYACDDCGQRFKTGIKLQAHKHDSHRYSRQLQAERPSSALDNVESGGGALGRSASVPSVWYSNDDLDEAEQNLMQSCTPDSSSRLSALQSPIRHELELEDLQSRPLPVQCSAPQQQHQQQQQPAEQKPLDLTRHSVLSLCGASALQPLAASIQPQLLRHNQQHKQPHSHNHIQHRFNDEQLANTSDDDWETMMEINQVDEMAKVREIVGNKPIAPPTDPNQCLICRRILSCKSALQMHYRTHTGERPFRCKICSRAFTTKGNLKTHMGVHRSKHSISFGRQQQQQQQLGSNRQPAVSSSAALQHQAPPTQVHNPVAECHICLKIFPNHLILQHHLALHAGQAEVNKVMPLVSSLHMQLAASSDHNNNSSSSNGGDAGRRSHSAHMQPAVTTSVAASPPPSQSHQQQQYKRLDSTCSSPATSSKPLTSPCLPPSSSAGQPFPVNMGAPGMSIPELNPFHAVMMPGRMDTPGSQRDAAARSSARQSTTCNICFKTFACNSALEIHYRSHTKERPFKCHLCGRGFSTRGNMKQHLLTHKIRASTAAAAAAVSEASSSNSSVADMPQAQTKLQQQEQLEEQQQQQEHIQQQQQAYKRPASTAEECDDQPRKRSPPALVSSSSGSGGGVLSIGDMPLVSAPDDPVASAPGPSPLESIQKMWAKTEPPPPRQQPVLSKHQCGVCYKHFSSSSALQIHMRTHTGDKPFKCNVCARAFTTKGNLKVHMGTHVWHQQNRRGRRIFDGMSANDGDRSPSQSPGPLPTSTGNKPKCSSPPLLSAAQPAAVSTTASSDALQLHGKSPLLPPNMLLPPFLPGANPFNPFLLPGAAPHHHHMSPFAPAPHRLHEMMMMWRTVCSVCHKVCANTQQLEAHLKEHLSAGSNGQQSSAGSAGAARHSQTHAALT